MISRQAWEVYFQTHRAAREALGWGRGSELEPLGRGVYNQAFLLQVPGKPSRVLRLGLEGNDLAARVAREAAVLAHLSGFGVTAEPLWFEPTGPGESPLLVMEFLPGRELDYRGSDLQMAAELYSRLHAVPGPFPVQVRRDEHPVRSFLEESRSRIERYDRWPDRDEKVSRILEAALRRLRRSDFPVDRPVLVHGDAAFNNWRLAEQGARLIDWDDCLVTTCAADLAQFLSPVTVRRYRDRRLTPEEREEFLRHYFGTRADRRAVRHELKRLLPAMVLRSLSWVAGRVADLSDLGLEPTPCLLRQLQPAFLEELIAQRLL